MTPTTRSTDPVSRACELLGQECNHFVNGHCATLSCHAKDAAGRLEKPHRFVGCDHYQAIMALRSSGGARAALNELHQIDREIFSPEPSGTLRSSATAGWQPIETAPIGVRVLCYWSQRFSAGPSGVFAVAIQNKGCGWHNPENQEDRFSDPTHWMPLPHTMEKP